MRHARNPEFLCGLVLAGQGVALERESATRREPRVTWRPLTGDPLWQQVAAVWPRRSPHPAAQRFAAVAGEVLTRSAGLPAPERAEGAAAVVGGLPHGPGRVTRAQEFSSSRTSRASSTEASISTLRMDTLSTLNPNGTPSRRQNAESSRAVAMHCW
ncbi:LysR substrate-binding domain-containing protein [Catellatospora coxensis]